jgi:hypothetical protein
MVTYMYLLNLAVLVLSVYCVWIIFCCTHSVWIILSTMVNLLYTQFSKNKVTLLITWLKRRLVNTYFVMRNIIVIVFVIFIRLIKSGKVKWVGCAAYVRER